MFEAFSLMISLVVLTAPFWIPALIIGWLWARRKRNYKQHLDRRMERALFEQHSRGPTLRKHEEPQVVQQRLEVHHHYHAQPEGAEARSSQIENLPPAARAKPASPNRTLPNSKKLKRIR